MKLKDYDYDGVLWRGATAVVRSDGLTAKMFYGPLHHLRARLWMLLHGVGRTP